MDYSMTKIRKEEQGFTLVELAVVMIIIGILIGGILKGQELITNARVTSTISQMEALNAAYQDFRNQYNAIPGDMDDADTRIGQCGLNACNPGGGDGTLDVVVGGTPGNEASDFFLHLLGAGYITGLDGAATDLFGGNYPTAAIGGGFLVGDTAAGASSNFTDANMRPGIWLVQTGQPVATDSTTGMFTADQAGRVDTKLDDGVIDRGGLQGVGGCDDGNGVYDSTDPTLACPVAYRM